MKPSTSKTIRQLILVPLFVVLFSLNIGYTPTKTVDSAVAPMPKVELSWVANAYADPTDNTTNQTNQNVQLVQVVPNPDLLKNTMNTVAAASTYVNKIFNPLIHYFTFSIGPFLGSDYIFNGNMGTMLQNIWVINRNIVNIIAVLLLLAMAIKHIFSTEGDPNLAKNVGKFAIMLVAVNFTWLAGRILLDAANVASNVVFAIPASISGVAGDSFQQQLDSNPCKCNNQIEGTGGFSSVTGNCSVVPGAAFLTLDATKTINYCQSDNGNECGQTFVDASTKGYSDVYEKNNKDSTTAAAYNKINRICWQKMKLSDYQQNNASYYLSYSMAKVQNLVRATADEPLSTAVGTLFSLVLQVAYLIAFLCLFIVLIMRAAMMWILMAFSPYVVLLMYSETIKSKAGEAGKILSLDSFVNWAFAPAKVGAVWTIGFIMITTGQTMDKTFQDKLGVHVYGAGTLLMGMDTVQQLIWYIMTLGILWAGTFAAFSDLGLATSITNRIKGTVEGLGMAGVKKAGAKLPIFPVFDSQGKAHGGTWEEATRPFKGAVSTGESAAAKTESVTNKPALVNEVGNKAQAYKAAKENEKPAANAALLKALEDIGIKSQQQLEAHKAEIQGNKTLSDHWDTLLEVLKEKGKPKPAPTNPVPAGNPPGNPPAPPANT